MGQDVFKEAILAEIHKNPMYEALKKAYEKHKRAGNIAQAYMYRDKKRNFEKDKFIEVAHCVAQKQKFVEDFTNSLDEADRKSMNILANAMVMIADVLEVMISDTNCILKKYNASKMTEFNTLNALAKEAKGFVHHLDKRLNDEKASFIFGQMSDDLYKLVFNKSASFVRKLKAHEKKKSKEKDVA